MKFVKNSYFLLLYSNFIIQSHLEEKFFKESVKFPYSYNHSFFEQRDLLKANFSKTCISFRHRHSEKDPLSFLMRLLMLERISGFRPLLTRAHNSIASFNLKKNFVLGAFSQLNRLDSSHFLVHFTLNCFSKLSKVENFYSESELMGTVGFCVRDIYMFPELDQEFQKWIDFVPPFSVAFQIDFSFSLKSYLTSLILLSHLSFLSF